MTQDEFYENIPSWISKYKNTWNHITLVAYFCHKYTKKHDVRFRLVKWKGNPGLGKESRDFAKLFDTIASEDYKSLPSPGKAEERLRVIIKIKNYIDWMFDYKFRSGERSVTGTRLFLEPSIINEFERMYGKMLCLHAEKIAFNKLVGWARDNIPDIFSSHQLDLPSDLSIISGYVETYCLNDDEPESRLLAKAREIGVL
jgi:hypothetical protein